MLVERSTNKLISNVETASQSFGIGDMSLVINLLTNLYSNPKQTLTQEYICNARDANREVKSSRPIEIYCPTTFKPVMRIRDFGPGLSPDRIANVFLYYGKSTKSESNEQTGGFGIGGKSAWAYTDSFLIHSFFNGTKYTYAAIKAENKPTLELLDKSKTDEPNGVCIEIAVSPKDIHDFQQAINRCVQYWDDSERPIIHGVTITLEKREVLKVFDNFEVFKYGWYNKYIIVDGVPYYLKNDNVLPKALRNLNHNFILRVKTGSVTIAPSREELIYDNKTIQYLTSEFERISQLIKKDLDKELQACKTLPNYIKWYNTAKDLSKVTFDFKGYKFNSFDGLFFYDKPSYNNIDKIVLYKYRLACECDLDGTIKKHYDRSKFNLDALEKTLFIDVDESPAMINRRLRTYVSETGINSFYVLLPNTPKCFIKDLEIQPLSKYAHAPVIKNTRSNDKSGEIANNEIVMWRQYSSRYLIDNLPKTIIYLPINERLSRSHLLGQVNNLYFISKEYLKDAAKVSTLILYDDWIKSQSLTNANKLNIFKSELRKLPALARLMHPDAKYSNNKLNDILIKFNSKSEACVLSDLVKSFTESSEYLNMVKDLEKLNNNLIATCPLLEILKSNPTKDEMVKIVNYINTNFKNK